MKTNYTIGQLARASGIATSTVRYYERLGIIRPDSRSESNYRLYGEETLKRLRFIRTSQATGFTLADVAILINLRNGSNSCCKEVQGLIEQRLADVKKRMDDLHHVQRVLQAALRGCQRTGQTEHCRVIDTLNAASLSSKRGCRQALTKNSK